MRKFAKKAFPMISAILIFLSANFYAAPETELSRLTASLKSAIPYTQEYIEATLSLSQYISENNVDEGEAKVLLDKALPRVAFYNQTLIKNLGNPQYVDVNNFEYVNETISEVDENYSMMSGEYEYKNRTITEEFKDKIARIRTVGPQKLSLIENSIIALTDTSTKAEVEQVYALCKALKKDADLISIPSDIKLASYLKKFEIDTADFLLRIIPQAEKSLDNLTENSVIRKVQLTIGGEKVKINESNIFTPYEVVDRFRLTSEGMGGKITGTEFTYSLPSKTPVCIAIDETGRVYEDQDSDPKTFTFHTEKLGDFTIAVQKEVYPYSTAFTSRMEWHYQNYIIGKLSKPIDEYTKNTIHVVSTAGITQIPYSILTSHIAGNRAIRFTNAGVTLYPSAMLLVEDKTADLPLEYLYSLAKATEKDAAATFEIAVNPPTTKPVVENENDGTNLVRLLAIAGALVFILAVIFTFRKQHAQPIAQVDESIQLEL